MNAGPEVRNQQESSDDLAVKFDRNDKPGNPDVLVVEIGSNALPSRHFDTGLISFPRDQIHPIGQPGFRKRRFRQYKQSQ